MSDERASAVERTETERARLSAAAARGDHAAFARIHARFAPGIRRLFLKRTGGRADLSEELAQQTWADVWRSLQQGRYDPRRAAISTYAYAIANHVWLRHCRLNSSDRVPEGREAARVAGPEKLLQHAELLDALRACLARPDGANALTDNERELVAAVARGTSERELAGRLGVAASTVNARKQAAYAKLRRCLALKGYSRKLIEQADLYVE